MIISQAYGEFFGVSTFCGKKAENLYNEDVADYDKTWINWIVKEVGCRLLNVAQTIVSVAALALNLIMLILAPLLTLCFEGPEKAWKMFKGGVMIEWIHYAFLPAAVLGILLPEYSPSFQD